MSILLYGCTTWTLTKRMERNLRGNCTRMLRAVLNKLSKYIPQNISCTDTYHPSRKPSKLNEQDMRDTTGEVRTSSSDVPLWTPSYGQTKVGKPARTYLQRLCTDTGCSMEDLPRAMDDWDEWRERVRKIRDDGCHQKMGGLLWHITVSRVVWSEGDESRSKLGPVAYKKRLF